MIIDFHCHLLGENIPSKSWADKQIEISAYLSGRPEEGVRERLAQSIDLSGDLLVKDMDEAGIDKSVLLLIDYGFFTGTGEGKTLEELHGIYAEAVRRHPDRLIAFAGVDPRRPEAVLFLERALKEWNMKGLKMLPVLGFYPNDKYCYLLYEKAQELGIPVLVHTGPESIPMYSKYGMPIYLDEVANDFPDLKIIMGHAGGCYWPEAASIASNKPNIFLDLAWWQPAVLRRPVDQFYKPLRSMLDTAGRSKVLFGSDWPGLRLIRRLPHAAWVKVFTDIPEEVKAAGIEFTEEEISGILGDNAAKLLRLEA